MPVVTARWEDEKTIVITHLKNKKKKKGDKKSKKIPIINHKMLNKRH